MVWANKEAQAAHLLRKLVRLVEPHELTLRGPMDYTDAVDLQVTLREAREVLQEKS